MLNAKFMPNWNFHIIFKAEIFMLTVHLLIKVKYNNFLCLISINNTFVSKSSRKIFIKNYEFLLTNNLSKFNEILSESIFQYLIKNKILITNQ